MPWITEHFMAKAVLYAVDPGGTGNYVLFTVPNLEYWELYFMRTQKEAGVNLELKNLRVADITHDTEVQIKADTQASYQMYDYSHNPLKFEAGGRLLTNVAQYTAGDTMSAYCYYKRWKWQQ